MSVGSPFFNLPKFCKTGLVFKSIRGTALFVFKKIVQSYCSINSELWRGWSSWAVLERLQLLGLRDSDSYRLLKIILADYYYIHKI